ncbi:hypothetical protein ID850_05420 [Xenorhabdus sp. Flor]|uniref:hypothetical protein n=1 Tax=Xenorhabdus cabanillasii TaxID=351673 RepID=UPI0019BA40A5|nr:hypothetical protein [Xenorhabdus sp. Flor]MBD2814216.1 hypothetical protein [Xenorhabdus sp. Flor]
MRTFTSATIKKPATKQKNTINIKGIVANIAPAHSLYTGITPIIFLADQYYQSNEQNHGMEIKNNEEFKHHILTTYRIRQKHTDPVPCYNLEPIAGYGYALYQRRGRYMHLVNVIPLIKTLSVI